MAETKKIINNPSITTNDFEYDEVGRVSAISGHPLAGEGGGTIVKSDLMWKPTVASDGYVHWTLASSATEPEAAYISGAQGPAGKDGTNGTNGISPTVSTSAIPGGSRVIFTYDNGETTASESIDVMSGASGANGSDGFSPTVVTADIPVSDQFPAGGTKVTITDNIGPHIFDISNGQDGQGATVNLLGGEGIEVNKAGANYTISVSADYAAKSYVDSASANALSEAKTWVGDQGYLTSVPDTYALKSDIPTKVTDLTDSGNYYKTTETSGANELATEFAKYVTSSNVSIQDTDYVMTTNGWKVLTLPGGGMTQVIHDETLTGQGNADDSKLGVAWSVLSGNTIASANSAYWAVKAKTNDGQHEYTIGTELASLNSITQYLDGWAETITGDKGVEALDTNEDGYPDTFQLTESVYSAIQEISAANNLVGANGISVVAGANNQVIIAPSGISPDKQYAMTITGWAEVQAGTTFTGVTTTGSISGGGVNNDTIGLLTSAENALTAVDNKVDKPTSIVDKYLVLRTDNAGNVSGWCDFQDQSYSKSEANGTFVATANIDTTTLSGDGKSVSTKLGVKTDVIATRDYVNSSFLPLSGGTVSGDVIVKSTGKNLLAVNTTATLMGQSRVANLTDTTALGTNWLGVNSYGGGFLKNVQGGNVGDLDGTSIQINFAPDGANSYGNITVDSQGNQSKIVHVPTASYNSMSSFDNTNGPNYMLRKTASGFDIGAAVINITALPQQTEANAYYFVYDV